MDDSPRRFRFLARFSLRTLLLLVFAAGAGFALWLHWPAWVPLRRLPNIASDIAYVGFTADGKSVLSLSDAGELRKFALDGSGETVLKRTGLRSRNSYSVAKTTQGHRIAVRGGSNDWEPPPETGPDYEAINRAALDFPVDLAFKDTPLEDALAEITRQCGRRGLALSLSGMDLWQNPVVTFSCLSMPCWKALDAVARSSGREVWHRGENWMEVAEPEFLRLSRIIEQNSDPLCSIRLWDVESGKYLSRTRRGSSAVEAFRFAAGGKLLIVGVVTGEREVWNVERGSLLRRIEAPNPQPGFVEAVSGDGRCLAATGVPALQDVQVWDLEASGEISLKKPADWSHAFDEKVLDLALSDDGRQLAVMVEDGRVSKWTRGADGSFGSEPAWVAGERHAHEYCRMFGFLPDGNSIILDNSTSEHVTSPGLEVRDSRTGELIGKRLPIELNFTDLLRCPGGRRIFTCSHGSAQAVLDVETCEKLTEIPEYHDNPDLDRIRAAWRRLQGEEAAGGYERQHGYKRYSQTFPQISPDGRLLLALDQDQVACVIERRRPEEWWGVAWLPEFWLTGLFALALLWSLCRDSVNLYRRSQVPRARLGNEQTI